MGKPKHIMLSREQKVNEPVGIVKNALTVF